MRILLVTSHRPEKSLEPLKCIKADVQTVTFNPKRQNIITIVKEIVDILLKPKTYKPEIVLCHGARHNSLIALVLAKLISRPFAVRLAGDIFQDYRTKMAYCRKRRQIVRLVCWWLTHEVELFVMYHSSGIITVANHLKEQFLSQTDGDLPLEDFYRLDNADPSVNRVYSNGEFWDLPYQGLSLKEFT